MMRHTGITYLEDDDGWKNCQKESDSTHSHN